jgi:hypothetical protein
MQPKSLLLGTDNLSHVHVTGEHADSDYHVHVTGVHADSDHHVHVTEERADSDHQRLVSLFHKMSHCKASTAPREEAVEAGMGGPGREPRAYSRREQGVGGDPQVGLGFIPGYECACTNV